jgi:phosphoribosylanthranilate isomerase
MSVLVKICGLSEPGTLRAAIDAGADYVGFVFFEKSPRHISYVQAASLAKLVPPHVMKVALTVDADDERIDAIVAALQPDMLQLHGAETPTRLAQLRAQHGVPLMKAIAIAAPEDPAQASIYQESADLLLFDAKPPKSMPGALPGGNGLAFDWSLIAGQRPALPWMLSGGLRPDNVAEALRSTGAEAVDVSSGVESAPGQKEAALIEAFIRTAKRKS